jgi:GST-like protein
MIDFYSAGTPNGYKVAIMLEECELPYSFHPVDLAALEQKRPDFLEISPNGRIPAIVDRDAGDFAVFESGAILVYLAEKTGRFLPVGLKERSRVMQWLIWQMGGLGPMIGQLNVFRHYFPEKLPSVISRYEREAHRLFGVLNTQLSKYEHVAGDDFTIADIACWPWVLTHQWAQLDISDYPAMQNWFDGMLKRPGLQRGLQSPPLSDPAADYDNQVFGTRKTLS